MFSELNFDHDENTTGETTPLIYMVNDKKTPIGMLKFGLGWDRRTLWQRMIGKDADLDLAAIELNRHTLLLDTVWSGNRFNRGMGITLSRDNQTGGGEGDDEILSIDFARLSSETHAIVITVMSRNGHPFSAVKNTFCRWYYKLDGRDVELGRVNPAETTTTALAVGVLQRTPEGGWTVTEVNLPGEARNLSQQRELAMAAASALIHPR